MKKVARLIVTLGLVCTGVGCDAESNELEIASETQESVSTETTEESKEDGTQEEQALPGGGGELQTEQLIDDDIERESETIDTTTFQSTGLAYGELETIEPGGDTTCSRGTPFRFFARGGSVNKVVIDFAGGGACWDEVTCSVAGAIFQEEAPDEETIKNALELNLLSGIYDQTNDANPFKDWFLIHIPYCTGDIHWGNSTYEYKEDLVIQHKGYVNTQSAMNYIKEHFPNPEEVFITGCSAGAYGAILHSTTVAQEFPDAKMTVLGDSGAGIITDEWFADSFPNWKAEEALPSWFELPGGTVEGLTIVDVYSEIANYHPNARFAQYTTAFDSNQEFYYTAMSGDPAEWGGKMLNALDTIVEATDNFTYYVTPGEVHCITPYSIMYTPPATGPTVVEWMSELLTAEETPAPTLCQGDECTDDVWCQECKSSDTPGWHCGHCVTD